MAISVEYSDLSFIRPRSWAAGRARDVQFIVVHYTAGSEGPTSAEDGASYDARRTDGTSCHYFVDQNSIVQCVETWNTAYSAYPEGNARGIHYELCGTAQSRAQWLDAASDATLWNAARQMARDCVKYELPVRHLTPQQMRDGEAGICGHGDVTAAWGQGDHTDPGPGFPWDVLLARVQQFVTEMTEPAAAPEDEESDDMKPLVMIRDVSSSDGPDLAVYVRFSNGAVAWLGPAEFSAYQEAGVPMVDSHDKDEVDRLRAARIDG